MRKAAIACLSMTAISFAPASATKTKDQVCAAPFERLVAADVFDRYHVTETHRIMKPMTPRVGSGPARLYRTVLREAAKEAPNFAGRYTIVRIGCGAATVCVAIVDAISGRVHFPTNLRNATALLMNTGPVDVEALNYRLDSRLLIVVGSPNEDEKRTGVSYYVWNGGDLELVRFVSAAELCRHP